MEFIIGIFAFISTLASAVLGWFARELWSAVKNLKEDLIKFKEDIHLNYIRKEDFRDWRDEVRGYLERIESKIDKKVDK